MVIGNRELLSDILLQRERFTVFTATDQNRRSRFSHPKAKCRSNIWLMQ